MATDVTKFLLSLAVGIAADADLPIAGDTDPPAIWIHRAREAVAAPSYTVLRIYGGDEPARFITRRYPIARIQADTRGKDEAAVIAQAWLIHDTLLDAQGRPRTNWALDGKRFDAADAIEDDPEGNWVLRAVTFNGAPGLIGIDEEQRSIATENYRIEFERVASS
jgi:hypothetical protein